MEDRKIAKYGAGVGVDEILIHTHTHPVPTCLPQVLPLLALLILTQPHKKDKMISLLLRRKLGLREIFCPAFKK